MISSFRLSGVRENFWFYFCGDNIIASKDTKPKKTDVTFLFEYILNDESYITKQYSWLNL